MNTEPEPVTITLTLKTSDLREGDVVICHGMRCLIDRPLELSKGHPSGYGGVRYTQALVLNRDDVPSSIVPLSWTADWKRNASRIDSIPHENQHRWTIQGNDLAHWPVERTVTS
jgi:hypothetical protein